MRIGIVGLGLIGGSMARAIARAGGHTVLAFDRSEEVMRAAEDEGLIADRLDASSLPSCDLLLVALYPKATCEYLEANAAHIRAGATVVDLCGVKGAVCPTGFRLAEEHGFTFIGGHPMAGRELSGFAASKPDLFDNASMVLVPPDNCPESTLTDTEKFFKSLGFKKIQCSTVAIHDREIAYTSQLCHVVSNAYVQSDAALVHSGFSAGSFRDLTRVARLKPDMWCELFLENKDALADELHGLIERLCAFEKAISNDDAAALTALLENGVRMKEESERE